MTPSVLSAPDEARVAREDVSERFWVCVRSRREAVLQRRRMPARCVISLRPPGFESSGDTGDGGGLAFRPPFSAHAHSAANDLAQSPLHATPQS